MQGLSSLGNEYFAVVTYVFRSVYQFIKVWIYLFGGSLVYMVMRQKTNGKMGLNVDGAQVPREPPIGAVAVARKGETGPDNFFRLSPS